MPQPDLLVLPSAVGSPLLLVLCSSGCTTSLLAGLGRSPAAVEWLLLLPIPARAKERQQQALAAKVLPFSRLRRFR